jgi:hypothetical protein
MNWRKLRILSVRTACRFRDMDMELPKCKARELQTPPSRNHLTLKGRASCLDPSPPSEAICLLQETSRCCSLNLLLQTTASYSLLGQIKTSSQRQAIRRIYFSFDNPWFYFRNKLTWWCQSCLKLSIYRQVIICVLETQQSNSSTIHFHVIQRRLSTVGRFE